MPPPLEGIAAYELPKDEAEWIARCAAKLEGPLSIEALRYAKEMLAEMGPGAVETLGRRMAVLRLRRDTQSLSSLVHAIGALSFRPAEETWPLLLPVLDHASPLARREALRGLEGCAAPELAEGLASRLLQDPALGRGRILAGQILDRLALAAGASGGSALALGRRAYELDESRIFHVDAGDDELGRYIQLLARSGWPRAAECLERVAADPRRASLHRAVVENSVLLDDTEGALRILRRIAQDLAPSDEARPLLLPLLRRALALLGDEETLAHFRALLRGEDSRSRQVALQALGAYGELDGALELLRTDPEAEVRMAAAAAISFAIRRRERLFPPDEWPESPLRAAATPEVVQALGAALRDPHPIVREEAARTAALIGAAELFAPLLEQLRSVDGLVRLEALKIVVAPRVRWRPAAAVMLEQLERIPPDARQEWLQAAVLLATPAEAERLVALLEREDLWGDLPAGEIAARYVGDLGRAMAMPLVALCRRNPSPVVKARAVRALMVALVADSTTRRLAPPRYRAPLEEGARYLVAEALDDPDLPPALRVKMLQDAPRYGGRAVAPLLRERWTSVPLPPRERSWTLRVLWEYF